MSDVAARLAPHIDRLALCVHRPAGRNAELLAASAELNPPRPTILVVHARVLSYRAVTLRDGELMQRFTPTELLHRSLDAHVEAGLLHPADGAFEPSRRCRGYAQLVVRVHGEIVDEMWHIDDTLARAADAICADVDPALHPAFEQQREAPDPPDASPSHVLLNRITALRYLRSDAHAAAMVAEDLTGPTATALTELWRATEPLPLERLGPHARPEHTESLAARGFAGRDGDRWTITDTGRDTRTRVEDDTNLSVEAALGDPARLDALLARIEPLDGTDPRS